MAYVPVESDEVPIFSFSSPFPTVFTADSAWMRVTVKVSVARSLWRVALTLCPPSVFNQPHAGNIGDPPPPRESQGRGAILYLCPWNGASLNIPATGYISDSGNVSFWNIDYYQHHFDVDTKTVGRFPRPVTPEN